MAQVYIPQPQDLLGMVNNIQQIQQGRQRMDLLNKNMEAEANALAEKKRQTEADNYFKLATVKGQAKESQQKYFDKFSETLGYPRMVLDDEGELIKTLQGIQKASEKDPTGDYAPLIQDAINRFGDDDHKLKQIDLLKKNIQEEKENMAGNFMSLLQGSGGVIPGRQDTLLQAFAQSGGTPELRKEATARLDQGKKLSVESPKAPTSRTVKRGDKEVTEEWDGRKWVEVGKTDIRGTRPESAYKAWEGVINTRMGQMWKKYNLTGAEIQEMQSGGDQFQQLLATFLAKKGLSPEATQNALTELQGLEEIRDQGYQDLEEGRSPYSLLKKKPPVVATADINRAAKSPDRAEERQQQRQDKAVPQTLPPGSKQIGTKNGNPVYEAPDGKRYMVTP